MNTLVVDDKQLAVNALLKILRNLEPEGRHVGTFSGEEALEYIGQQSVDVVFLDIEMPGMNGLTLAKRIKDMNDRTNIIFVTGYSEYALEAHSFFVSGFLMKPASMEEVKEALEHLRYPVEEKVHRKLWIQCFGNFEVFCDGVPIHFQRSKTKELFAYLVDQKGAKCTMGELLSVLWENKPDNLSQRTQLRTLIHDLRTSLERTGNKDLILRYRNEIAIDVTKAECDYYDFLHFIPDAVNSYHGEYMKQYSWAEMTHAQFPVMD